MRTFSSGSRRSRKKNKVLGKKNILLGKRNILLGKKNILLGSRNAGTRIKSGFSGLPKILIDNQ